MRTLEDIVPPSKRQAPSVSEPQAPSPSRPRGKFPMGTLLIVVVIIGACGAALYYFGSAEVKITPNKEVATVNASFKAAVGSDLPFEVISAQKIATQSVQSTGSRAVSKPASGTITISNAQKVAQKLITNTRFQTQGGLVFRIHSAVTVPAAKGDVPGTATATVYADQPGGQYNVGPTSFTLPGLAGSPTYTLVTAKSTDAMSGGASGNEPIIASDVETSTRGQLGSALTPELAQEIQSQVPQGYVLLPGASATSFQPLPSAQSATAGMVDLKQQGTITAVVFPSSALAKAIASTTYGAEYTGANLSIKDPQGLTLTPSPALPSKDDQSFSFKLAGTANLIYVVDPARIAGAVAGKSNDDAQTALRNYPEVKQAVLILRPFWKRSFPEDPSAITVTVGEPDAN